MNDTQARMAVETTARAVASYGTGHVRAEGRVLGYSIAPMVLLETDGGELVWWRADMVDFK